MQLFVCQGEQLILHPSRVIYWEAERTLILSDLHFGKTGHFRKEGIPVPQNVYIEDLQRLVSLIQFFNAGKLIIVGDFFHSESNKELELFRRWRSDLSAVEMHLVKGNHDILHDSWYEKSDVIISQPELKVGPFNFCHDPSCITKSSNQSPYSFVGHLHPGISIRGMGKQSYAFPVFISVMTIVYCRPIADSPERLVSDI
jgi:DNA ligase-associated metallophosphoesterase